MGTIMEARRLAGAPERSRYLIARYPAQLIDRLRLADGRMLTVRPVLPQDAGLTQAFVQHLSPKSRYRRFHVGMAELPSGLLHDFTEIDYASHLALIAECIAEDGEEIQVGEARYVREADSDVAEFALAVADAWQRSGLGSSLLARLIRAARGQGLAALRGEVLADNAPMLALLRGFGARLRSRVGQAGIVEAWIDLDGPSPGAVRPC